MFPLSQLEFYLYYMEHETEYRQICEWLVDEESRRVWQGYWQGMMGGSIYFPQLFSPQPYWGNDIIPVLSEGEHIVYAGVAEGESLDRALMLNPYVEIHGFEPNSQQYKVLKEKYRTRDNVYLYNYGLADGAGNGLFASSLGYSSRIVQATDDNVRLTAGNALEQIRLQSVDNMIKGKVDLIALDIEGAEVEALRGSYKSIMEWHPKLAISVYHKVEHYLTIPELLKSYHEDYKLYFRQHSMTPAESVIYAL